MPTPPGPGPSRPPRPPSPLPPGALVAIIVVVSVLVGALAYSQSGGAPTSSGAPRTTEPEPSGSPPGSASSESEAPSTTTPPLQQVVAEIKAFVERERGLRFTADVPVKLAGNAEFEQIVGQQLAEEEPQVAELGRVLVGLTLLDQGEDVVKDVKSLDTAAVVGFYDPKSKQLVVRGSGTSPYVRKVLAHELTHALDDQQVGLDRPQLEAADDETGFGFTALVEGSARKVEEAYYASLTPDEQAQADDEELQLSLRSPQILTLPPILITILQEPYQDGSILVRRILGAGQQAALDAAFANPPTTSEQVLDPAKYLSGEAAIPVAEPATIGGAPVQDRGALGAYLLEQALSSGPGDVRSTIAGWGGDRYVTWQDGARTCLRDRLVGQDAAATARLGEALAGWARRNGATVEQEPAGSLLVTSCR